MYSIHKFVSWACMNSNDKMSIFFLIPQPMIDISCMTSQPSHKNCNQILWKDLCKERKDFTSAIFKINERYRYIIINVMYDMYCLFVTSHTLGEFTAVFLISSNCDVAVRWQSPRSPTRSTAQLNVTRTNYLWGVICSSKMQSAFCCFGCVSREKPKLRG